MTYSNSDNNKAKDPLKTLVYLKKNEKYSPDAKYPYLRGFLNISREQIEALLLTEPDAKYGTYKLDIAVWTGDVSGVLKGNATLPQPRGNEQFKRPEPKQYNNTDNF
jgi:hypothetical protein